MSDGGTFFVGILAGLFLFLAVATVFDVTYGDGYRAGACMVEMKHALTSSDTLRLLRTGCSLP